MSSDRGRPPEEWFTPPPPEERAARAAQIQERNKRAMQEFDLIWRAMDGPCRVMHVYPDGRELKAGPDVYPVSILVDQIDDVEMLRQLIAMYATAARMWHDMVYDDDEKPEPAA